MSSYIESTKKACKEIITKADDFLKKNKLNSNHIEFSVVDYNDHDSESGPAYKECGKYAAKTSGWQNEA